MKTLLAFHDAASDAADRLAFAARLARKLDAHLTSFSATVEPAFMLTGEIQDSAEIWGARLQALREQAADLARAAEECARRHGLQPDCRSASLPLASLSRTAALHARYADLAVIGCEIERSHAPLRQEIFDGVIFDSGRPALVTPPEADVDKLLRRIVIAWDGGMRAARALSVALPLLSRAEAVSVVVVAEKADADAFGEQPGGDISHHLARHGISVQLYQAPAAGRSIGKVIADCAEELDAGMIVMGAYGHSRFRETLFGGASRDLLETPPAPLFMAH